MKKKIAPVLQFQKEVEKNIKNLSCDQKLSEMSLDWMIRASRSNYSYNFAYLGRPVIQFPTDIFALQELIWEIKPTLIIETGIAHGGSLIFSASMLALLDYTNALSTGGHQLSLSSNRKVLGIDVDIRPHNRDEIVKHPLSGLIHMLEGSSTDASIVKKVREISENHQTILVCLDSNHSYDHVLEELRLYAPLVSVGSYCVVFDTIIEKMPEDMFANRNWGKSNNPHTAVNRYLYENDAFIIDKEIFNKLQISVCPNGYLKRIK